MSKLLMVVNEDRFFLSHRKEIAISAQQNNYDVTILTKNTGHFCEIESLGLKAIDLPINPTGMNLMEEWRTFKFLRNIYAREKPDIVHHVGLKNILWGGLAARILDIRGVVNAVSGLGGLFNDGNISTITRIILYVMKYSNNRPGVKVIFQNNDDMAIFLENKVVSKEQIEFTKGSGIDLNDYSFVDMPNDDCVNIIFTARMVREKGVCDLIKAAEILKSEYKRRVKFLLCGRLTPNKTGITEEYMKEHCDGEYICWLGERKDIHQLLKKSHIMAFPSYYREGVPKSLIEASAIGRPIVTCNSVGCKDVVDDGVNGFLVPPKSPEILANKLSLLIKDRELRSQMGLAARRIAERDFSLQRVIDTHIEIYRQLILE